MIRILDSFIADKIAAGEVIERPVSAAKELIENSIDAGASSIIIEIRGGGSSYMRITDDGSGIASEDIETAFLRHATSKIESAQDLDNIRFLGFRGEALASISAVSRLTIVSKTADEQIGTKLVLHAGRVIQRERVGANQGTTIIVEDLFYNTPARRKFMKSEPREASTIIELVQQYAICYSNIRFMMINNGQTLFSTAGDGDTEAVIKSLYPDNAHLSLLELEGDGVRGYISAPSTTLSGKKGQLFYVNGRPVQSKIIEKALTDGYGGRIFSGFPVAILFIDEDPYALDVNIHPGKKEVLFLHANELSSRISNAVSDAINTDSSLPTPELKAGKASNVSYSSVDTINKDMETPIVSEQTDIKEYLCSLNRDAEVIEPEHTQADEAQADQILPIDSKAKEFDFNNLMFKGYVFDTYIITETEDALYVFDQHAAHERIFYEKLVTAYNSDEKLSQPILSPITISMSADVYLLSDFLLDSLNRIGYDISDFGAGTFIIRSIPSFMSAGEAEEFASVFCESSDNIAAVNNTVIEKLIMKSCKSAVKGGDRLSELEIKELIDDLAGCKNPYSCPHGRPTFIKINKYDAERLFNRK